jgi:hypothetical protein
MEDTQDRPEAGARPASTSTRSRMIWILLGGSFGPVLVAKYLVPSLMAPMLVLSGVMIAAGVALILRGTPTDQ